MVVAKIRMAATHTIKMLPDSTYFEGGVNRLCLFNKGFEITM